MVVELTSSRIVAPIIGASIFTWTAVIGVTLLGLSIGSIAGGYIADKYFERVNGKLLSGALFISAILVALIVPLSHAGDFILENISSISAVSTALCVFLFLLPAAAIGTIQPITLRLYAHSFDKVAREYGLLSGTWSFGGIIGVFVTGFYLISHIGSSGSIYAVSIILFVLAIQSSGSKKSAAGLMLCATLCALPVAVFSADQYKNPNVIYDKETDYYHARVIDYNYFPDSGNNRWLFLDFDSHSVKTDQSAGLYTDMSPIFSAFSELTGHSMDHIHVIGAGGYVLPENLRVAFPKSDVSVSEVDPELVDIGNRYFNLAKYDIKTDISDARVFFNDKNTGTYDLIFGDAYNSFISVPWYLMTREFLGDIKSHLNIGGIYAINFIGSLDGDSAGLFHSVYATVNKSFPNNYIFAFGQDTVSPQNITIIGMNSGQSIPYETLRSAIEKAGGASLSKALVNDNQISDIKQDISKTRILTDDFAPVEDLMLPTVNEYFRPYLAFYDKVTK